MNRTSLLGIAFLLSPVSFGAASAQETVRLREDFRAGHQYRVNLRVDLGGRLFPSDKGKTTGPIAMTGTSALDYDERVLGVAADGTVDRTVRIFRRVDFARKVGDQPQTATIRPEVRRLVVRRHGSSEVPFCPEGPLTLSEIDVVRYDLFAPALAGLLPETAVALGARWSASTAAVKEMTDLEEIDEGKLECKLEGLVTLEKRKHARVAFVGTVRGVGQDGPTRHTLEGFLYFDLESNHLSYLALKGIETPLRDGKEAGRIEGQLVLTRQVNTQARELSDEALRGLMLTETEDNTLLLFESVELGVRFAHSRRWRLTGGFGRQVRLDAKGGGALQVTLLSREQTPTAATLLARERAISEKRGEKVLRTTAPQRLTGGRGDIEHFTLEAEIEKRATRIDFFVLRQDAGGAVVSVTLPERDAAAVLKEAERLTRSVALSRPGK